MGGANTGLGAEAALDLAKRGATLVLACRSFERTRPIVKQIREESGNNDVHYMHLDLASLQSVREFAGEVQAKYPAIHTLVCNAGVWMPMDKQAKTEDGFEVHAGVNHLGHFLLTSLLLDRLENWTSGGPFKEVSCTLWILRFQADECPLHTG